MANVSSSNGLEKRPKLRFPGFDEPWEICKAESLFRNITDKNHPDDTVLTIVQGKGTLPRDKSGRNIHYDDASLSNYKRVEKGDFIIHLRSFEGGLEMAHETGIVSPAYTILRCSKPHSSLFYEAYFHTDEFINHALSKAVEGIRDGRQISYEAFKWLGIPYCTNAEQEKISGLFDAINRRIEKQEQIVNALKKYKRGLISDLFCEKSTQGWTTSRYYFSEIAQRRGEKYDPSSGIEYPCVELENIEQETGKILATVPSIKQGSIKNIAKSDDTLFGKLRPYLRKYAFVQQTMACSSEIWALIPSDVVLPKFLFYLVQTDQFLRVANISSGTKMPRTEWSNIEKAEFYIPDLPVQRKVVMLLEGVDKKISFADSVLIFLNMIKAGMLQQLFI